MRIKKLHPNFTLPIKGTDRSGAHDIFMPEMGFIDHGNTAVVPLGFAAAVPAGHVALLLPRSGVGTKEGLELNNTCGVIDEDYTGEWKATLRTKNGKAFAWGANQRLLQFLIVPVTHVTLELVDELDATVRGEGGFGSTGK